MSKTKEFNGDKYVELVLDENQITDLDQILEFIENHENVYLFGQGKCGNGFKEYADICGLTKVKDFITSDKVEEFLKRYQPGRDGVMLTLKADFYREVLPELWGKIDIHDLFFFRERSKQIFIQTFSREFLNDHFWLTLPVTKHCNINCSSCNMFSPLCEKEFYTLENIKKDLGKIKEIDLKLDRINITGGEPFLNPELLEILFCIRTLYPKLKIDVYTNGLPIMNYTDEQFELLKKCNTEIQVTEYGISDEKLKFVYNKFEEFNISYRVDFFEDSKLFFKKPIDFDRKAAPYEFINCQYYTFCFSLFVFNGILYKCAMALNAQNINRYSDKKLELTDKDYLNLDDVKSPEQIHDFWRSRLPMCSYCPRVFEVISWKPSERKIEEWM